MDYAAVGHEAVFKDLATSASGISVAEAKARLKIYGPNELPEPKIAAWWKIVLSPFANWFVIILLLALVVSLLTGHAIDALVIAAIIALDAVIEWSQHFSAKNVLATLKSYDRRFVLVRRGQVIKTDTSELVPGDIVLLNEGDKVPADGRIISTRNLQINEASLTGESLPAEKSARKLEGSMQIYEQTNMVWQGTVVVAGRGEFCVIATGASTQLAKIAKMSVDQKQTAPVQTKIDQLVKMIIIAVGAIGALTFMLGVWRGANTFEHLRFVLALCVSAIPEGLPIALTIILLLSIKQMAKRKALVKKLPTVETLGMVTLIATDKTGTLTLNNLEVSEVWPHQKNLKEILSLAVSWRDHSQDPLNVALASEQPPGEWAEVDDLPFALEKRISGVLWRHEKKEKVYIKGAPEAVLALCRITPSLKSEINAQLNLFLRKGYKVVAIAHGVSESVDLKNLKDLEFDLLVGLGDAPRPRVSAAIALARRAGIKVMMLTGDHILTASAVAQQTGIIESPDQVESGEILSRLDNKHIPTMLDKIRAWGRVLPEHKFKILEALRGQEITAMTGDGVNDAPALVAADVGIAMGSGSDAAKEAGDLILLDDNFSTIVEAIKVGRAAYANIRKMLFYLLSTNLGEVLTMTGALILGLPLPVTATQILWINLVTDGSAVIPLGLDKPEDDLMNQPPRSPNEPLLNRALIWRLLTIAITMALVTLAVFVAYLRLDDTKAQTMAFAALVVMQWANALNARSETSSITITERRPNRMLWGGLAIAAALQVLVLFTPLGQRFDVVALGILDVLILIGPFTLIILVGELSKKFASLRQPV